MRILLITILLLSYSPIARAQDSTPAPQKQEVASDSAPKAQISPEAPIVEKEQEKKNPHSEDDLAITKIFSNLSSTQNKVLWDALEKIAADHRALFDPSLRHFLKREDLTEKLKNRALKILAELEWPQKSEDLESRIATLRKFAWNKDAQTRSVAIAALAGYPMPQATRALILRKEGASAEESAWIEAALEEIASPERVQNLAQWLSHQGKKAEEPLADTPLAAAALEILIHPKSSIAPVALASLNKAKIDHMIRPLLLHLLNQGNSKGRNQAAKTFSQRPLDSDLPILANMLESGGSKALVAANILVSHRGEFVSDLAARHILNSKDTELQKLLANVLREQELKYLHPAIQKYFEKSSGYSLALYDFLISERNEDELTWCHAQMHLRTNSQRSGLALASHPLKVRETVLIPRLIKSKDDKTLLKILLKNLSDTKSQDILPALQAVISPNAHHALFHLAITILQNQPEEAALPLIEKWLEGAEPSRRKHLYYWVLKMQAPEANALLATRIQIEKNPELTEELIHRVMQRNPPAIVKAVATQLNPARPVFVQMAAMKFLIETKDTSHLSLFEPYMTRAPQLSELEPSIRERIVSAEPNAVHESVIMTLIRSPHKKDQELALGLKAFTALYTLPEVEATRYYDKLALDKSISRPLRLQAIVELGESQDAAHLATLKEMSKEESIIFRSTAHNAMHAMAPDIYPPWDSHGRMPLVVSSAAFGATLLTLATRIADETSRQTLLGTGGAAIGGTTAYLLTINQDVTLGESLGFTSLGVWGTLGGYSLGRVMGLHVPDEQGNARAGHLWSAMAGELLGVAAGSFIVPGTGLSVQQVALLNAGATSWGMGALSLAYLLRLEGGTGTAADVFTLGTVAGIIPLSFLASELRLEKDVVVGTAATMAFAGWVGAFAPLALTSDNEKYDVQMGMTLGAALGLSGGLALSTVTKFNEKSLLWGGVGALTGATAGMGLGLSEPNISTQLSYGFLEAGTLLGGGILGWLGPDLKFTSTDYALIAMLAAGGALTGSRAPAKTAETLDNVTGTNTGVDQGAGDHVVLGGAMLGGSLGTFAGLAISQWVDLSPGDLVLTAVTGGVLGMGGAGFSMLYAGSDIEEEPETEDGARFSAMFSAGATIGAIGMSSYLAPRLKFDSDMALFTLTSGALGAFWGGWIPAWDTDEGVTLDQSRQLGGAAFASSLAIVGSTALAQYTPFDPSRTRRTAFGAMGGGVLGAGIGLLLPKSLSPDHDRQLTVGLMQAGAIGGFTRAIFTEKKREYSSADRGLMAYMAASGMIHGSLIPHMWRNPNDDIPQDEIIGGAMVGASLGLGAARLRSKYIKSNASDIGEMFIMQSYGMATAWGMSELWDFDRRNQNNTLNGLSIGALTLGSFVAAHTEYGSRETTLTGITTLEGATAGAGLANLLIGQQYATSHQRASAAALGAGLGGFIGMGLSQTTQLTQDDAKESLAMALITGATSTSLALFLSDEYSNDEYMTAGSLGWLAGASAGLLLAPYTSYDASKNLNTILLATHGALAGAFLPEMIAPNENPNRTRRPGAIGLSAGTLTLAALGANHLDIINKEDILESMATAALLSNVTYNYGAIARTPFLNGERLQLAGFGYWGGAVLGMGVARFTEFDDSDRNFMALMGIHGALGGAFLPEIFDSREEALSSERGSGALFGAGAMSLLSMGLSQTNLLDEGDAFESIISAALFADLAYGFDAITKPNGSEGKRLQLTGHAYWGGALLGLLAAPFTTWDSESQEVAKLLTMQGAAGGVFLSELLDPDEPVSTERHVHGAMLGSGVYGLLGVGLAQTNLLEEDDVYESMYWSSLLAVGGYGYGKAKLVTQSQAQKNRFADMGWWAGSTLGLLAAPFTTHTEEAALWTLPIGGLGALAGYYMPTAIHGDSTSEMRKGAMTAGAAAGIFTLHLANQFIPIPDPERAAEASGFALLANTMTFGLGRAGLIGEGRTEALVNEGALAAGFIAGAIAAPYAEYSNKDLPLILALSSMGGVHGYGLPTAIGESDTQEQQGGAIFGASAATLLGYGLAQLHPLEQRSIPALTLNWLAGVGIGGGGAVLFNGNDEKGAAQAAQIGGLIGATLAYPFMPRTIFESENKSLLVFAPLWGAWHGYGLATAMGDDDSDSDLKTRHQGGFIFGTSLGLAAGIGLAPLVDLEAGDAVEASLYMGAAQLVGNGLGNLVFDTTQSRSFFETSLGIAGLGAGLLLAPHTEYETNDPLLVIGTTALGLAHSGLLKDVLPESSLGSSAASRMKLGAGLGLGAGFALSQFNNIDRIDLFEISLAMAAGDAVGFGLYEALSENHHRDDNGTRNALTLTTGLAGAALGFYGAVESDYSSSDRLLVAYGLAGGAWLGAWAPELLSYTDGDNHAGGLLFGMGAGALGAAVASQYFEYDRGDVAEILIGSSASSAMGAGAGLLLSSKDDNRPFVALMELGGIAGTLAFGALAPEVEHSSSDAWLGLLAASYGLYQGAGLSLLADADDDKVQGAMLLTGSAGLLVGGYFGRQLSLDQTDLLMLLAGSAWGVWTGVWTAAALEEANLQDSDSLLSVGMGTTAIATDLAILATSIAISEFVNMPPEQFAWISVGGGMGMVVGLLGSELTGEKIFGNRAGIALGSVSGLLAGAAITSLFDWSRPELVVPETITLSSSGDLPDWVPQVEMWFPQVGAAMPFENTNDYGSTPGSDAFMFSVVGYYQ